MPEPRVYSIPPEGSFVDRLAKGLRKGFPFGDAESGNDELALARTLVLLPNRRAVRSVTEAFVRVSDGALLLPRLTTLGDLDDDLMPGLMAAEDFDRQPAIDELERTLRLMPLIERWQKRTGQSRAKVETLRYAEALGRALDLMQLYEVPPDALDTAVEAEMAEHWQDTATFLNIVRDFWPDALAQIGKTDRAAQRQKLIRRMAARWKRTPPPYPVIAAGIANAEPAGAELLGVIARMPQGAVVLPGLDTAMDEAAWDRLSSGQPHPQVPLKLLLDGMSIARGEVRDWPEIADSDGPKARGALLSHGFATPEMTADWRDVALPDDAATGMFRVQLQTPAEEAMAIALAMREVLETPGKTAALVTPDRDLARRVAAQMRRWNVDVDDSAGTPLGLTPPGSMLRLALEAAASGFAPVALMALLKHPLAGPEATRGEWLGHVRRLDLALRGVRPARGLQGVRNRLSAAVTSARQPATEADLDWWKAQELVLRPVAELFQRRATGDLSAAAAKLRNLIGAITDERFWEGNAGRAASDILASLETYGAAGGMVASGDLPALLGAILGSVPVRPSYGRHPRLAIYGLLEARLQRADLMILGGLNEGVWPSSDSFDPWLPPKIRTALGLPPTDRATALSAHDFVQACGARHVLLTRARRDASAPAVASRFWLRLGAILGGQLKTDERLIAWAADVDKPSTVIPAGRPKPCPPAAERPKRISVTEVEVLRADPYQFWAKRLLRLNKLDALGEEADAAARGTIVHDLMEKLSLAGTLSDQDARSAAIDKALKAYSDHPLLGAMWRPRVERMLTWAAEQMAAQEAKGWRIAGVETEGRLTVDGVELRGKADVIFQREARLAVADYKTGAPPAAAKIRDGYADQLALLAWLADEGKFAGISGEVAAVAYWRLSGGNMEGEIKSSSSVTKAHPWSDLDVWLADGRTRFREAAARWLTGDEPFTARLKPEYAPYTDYAQLARVAEWEGRVRSDD